MKRSIQMISFLTFLMLMMGIMAESASLFYGSTNHSLSENTISNFEGTQVVSKISYQKNLFSTDGSDCDGEVHMGQCHFGHCSHTVSESSLTHNGKPLVDIYMSGYPEAPQDPFLRTTRKPPRVA